MVGSFTVKNVFVVPPEFRAENAGQVVYDVAVFHFLEAQDVTVGFGNYACEVLKLQFIELVCPLPPGMGREVIIFFVVRIVFGIEEVLKIPLNNNKRGGITRSPCISPRALPLRRPSFTVLSAPGTQDQADND
jgi:hypothetical protein